MDISEIKGKGKGYKGKGKQKGKSKGKGKGYGGYKGKGKGYKGYGKGPVGQGNPFGSEGQFPQQMNKGKGKGHKGKQAQGACYRCGQPGHIAKHCRVPVYNYGEAPTMTTEQYDNTHQWHEDPHGYENYSWHTWDIKDKTCNINHKNLHCQHQMPQLQQTIRQ